MGGGHPYVGHDQLGTDVADQREQPGAVAGLSCHLDLDLGPSLGEQVEMAAYYIASEALANAAKHAHASVIDLRVHTSDGGLALSIRDDGAGGADPRRGSGLIGLKDRVEALGGTISVHSPPGHGTTLHVRLPPGASPALTPPPGTE